MNQKIHILGTCATRDTFRILNKNYLVGRYSSRSSLISRLAPPFNFDFHAYFNGSNLDWKQKMIVQDFDKNGLYIDDYANGILIIDFIDEMFQLLKVNNTFITKSTEFVRCGLEQALEVETFRRGNEQDFDLWIDACHKLTSLVPQKVREKTILHKAFWANNYLDKGMLNSFDNQDGIEFYNRNLTFYYKNFESIYSPGYTIEIPSDNRIADANHEWGLAPFHYTFKYYEEFYRQLCDRDELNNF